MTKTLKTIDIWAVPALTLLYSSYAKLKRFLSLYNPQKDSVALVDFLILLPHFGLIPKIILFELVFPGNSS